MLIPDTDAGCSLAASIDATALRAWKAENPDAVVVSYVNTTAEVKALSDYCCTSGNAEAVINAVPEDRDILFLPDMFLGTYLERVTGRRMKVWPGECHVHAGIRTDDVRRVLDERPGLRPADPPRVRLREPVHVPGLRGRERRPSHQGAVDRGHGAPRDAPRPADEFVVATETGILHRLAKEAPDKRFVAMSERAVCRYMKMITLEKLRDSLREMKFVVTVDPATAERARGAIRRMVEIV